MPRIKSLRAEVGTTGTIEEVAITGDAGADIATAIGHEHYCTDDDTCDIARSLEDGYPFWSAQLLQSATECPLLDAVISFYCSQGLDFGAMADVDRDGWLASDTWTKQLTSCQSCGSYTFGSDIWEPSECGNCGADFPRLTDDQLESFIAGYVEAALWTTSIEEDFAAAHNAKTSEDWREDASMLDFGFTHDDIASEAMSSIEEECRDFCEANYRDLLAYADKCSYDPSQGDVWSYAGHDFLLTRDGHGAGFWDHGLGELGDRLTDASKPYGDSGFYIGDDGSIYAQ